MAATTTLLGLLTPTQGTLSGTWGDSVNYGISDYVDIAIAGTLSFAGDGAITLANTLGSASGNGITSTTAQYMVIRITGTQSVVKVITGPSYSKLYMVDHAGATSAVTFKAAGQTGVSVAVGEKCFVYYNGTDYVKVASSVADGVTTIDFGSTGLTPATATSGAVTVAGTLAVANGGTNASTASIASFNNITGYTASGATGTTSTNLVFSASPTFTGTPLAPTATTGTNTTQLATTAFVQNQIGAIATGVSSFSAGTTGFTPSTATTGVVTLSGTLGITNGGTGTTSTTFVNAATNVTGTLPIANGGTGNTSGAATLLQTTNFSISEVGGKLVFKYGATTIASMDSSGNLITIANVTAYGTP